jgi:hypothetical protein
MSRAIFPLQTLHQIRFDRPKGIGQPISEAVASVVDIISVYLTCLTCLHTIHILFVPNHRHPIDLWTFQVRNGIILIQWSLFPLNNTTAGIQILTGFRE